MDKTININLAGNLFQIDEDAFRILRDYLQAINNRFRNVQGGLETIEDIESRIAEIFQSQKGLAGAVSKENVEAMISIIGKPEDFDVAPEEANQPDYRSSKKRLYRNPDDSIVSGVCGGIGAYLNTDPVLFRILFVISALVFGTGILVYLVLWIALPPANTDSRQRELYGNGFHPARSYSRQTDSTYITGAAPDRRGNNATSNVNNAFNEIFNAIGKVFYVIFRIFLIIIGVTFVLTGFLCIISFIMIFVFKYPGAFSTDAFDVSLIYFPDFLNYIVNPAVTPWIIALTVIAVILPMLALVYWGVKMIFWFKAKDGVFSLVGLVLWVISITVLALLLFNEGISFAETGRSSSETILNNIPDTLYIKSDHKVSDLRFDKELTVKEERYTLFINEERKELYIRPYLKVNTTGDDVARVDIRRGSTGRSESDAMRKADELIYNYRITRDTLFLDEYFTIPSDRKWAADNIGINLYLPEGTILKVDRASVNLFHSRYYDRYGSVSRGSSDFRTMVLTDDGLKTINKRSSLQE
jgi:phage shock protein PspC (stress-responsive transcriptional regulator)